MFRGLLTTVFYLGAALGAQGFETVHHDGKLSDQAFYMAVACAAPPGEKCRERVLKWPSSKVGKLTIGISSIDEGYPPQRAKAIQRQLNFIVKHINGLGSGVQLALSNSGKPDIFLELIDTTATPLVEDDTSWEQSTTYFNSPLVWTITNNRGSGRITAARLKVAADISTRYMRNILLDSVVHSLGLTSAIKGDYYRKRSVFSADLAPVSKIKGQDAMALRTHYPPAN